MLKKLILTCLVASAMAAPSAFAVSTVTLSDGPGNTGGGEFNATTSANGNFITFCLEYNEHITMGVQYYYQISTATSGNGDHLSLATAWLYNQFLNGALVGYDYTPDLAGEVGHRDSANNLQRAIWFLESESGGAINSYVTDALNATDLTLDTKDASDANGAYGVQVMNMWQNYNAETGVYSGAKQDQIIRIPRVPDGGTTLALLGMSMGFVAFASRRMRR